ncbi:putative acetyltransferase [compost metagenome]
MDERLALVAILDDEIAGTAALDGNSVRSVFIAPQQQRKGIGQALMARIEETALERGIDALLVPSSITAEAFYTRLGYSIVREQHHGEERTIIMTKPLHRSPPL